ncbi:arginine biosynthesis protein ArgJ [Schizophyllum commune H4-8]|uniref:Arginine biosynthesis bifunctional protein ArgJ, mitochondrial n=1 Tax=Schizophyllum commune (strain H4-8 / FGSC 9210) TaxID=578458 RepID=D8QE25_SCHCM|nr:arginine biosynthesis protein ArgJ [Schizophyllum commune H4-8]KAI5888475.1 arginine biosynthesis protein ArgJ [Schizophyllum commune H4-8]
MSGQAPSKAHLHKPILSSKFPVGYAVGGSHCGVKKDASVNDLALVVSTTDAPASAAACFTRNAFKAAPVLVSQEVLEKSGGRARAIVVNSGCANAVTGTQGMKDAWAMSRETDKAVLSAKGDSDPSTLVMSTGVIGQTLPIAKILDGIRASAGELGSDFAAWERAAKAFMTTDTFPKMVARTFTLGEVTYRMAGIAKGAGMIHPDMAPALPHATLLGCVVTDAAVAPKALQKALAYAVDRSFNSISVDGDMSTNDTIVALANGAAGGQELTAEDPAFPVFQEELKDFTVQLAQLVVRDGEGATKFVTVSVKNAPTYEDAHKIASKISTSALVKTALFGEDANWGRVLAATGSVPLSNGAAIDTTKVNVTFIPSDGTARLPLLVNGEPEKVDEDRAKEILSLEDIEVEVDLGLGSQEAKYWTCDLSYDYVKINGDYRS